MVDLRTASTRDPAGGEFCEFFLRDFVAGRLGSVRGPSSVRWCNSDRALESR